MHLCFDHSLEDKLSQIEETICHTTCKECKDARVSRLETRVSLFHREKRRHEGDEPASVVFHDVREAEYYPFGIKHHHNIHTTIHHKYVLSDKHRADLKACTSPSQAARRAHVLDKYLSQSQGDELLLFHSRLRDTRAPKRQRVSTECGKHVDEYASSLSDVDVATLKSHKTCTLKPKGAKTSDSSKAADAPCVEAAKDVESAVDPAAESAGKTEASPAASAPAEDTTKPAEPVSMAKAAPSAPAEPVKPGAPLAAAAAAPPPPAAAPSVAPIEARKDDPGSIFGSSTLEKLNFSMPVGNPLFAPKAIDAGSFSVPKAPPMFVFGAQQTHPVSPILPTPQFPPPLATPPAPAPVAMAPPTPQLQFNIPGFADAQLTPAVMGGPNAFAANAFPKAKRGGMRPRSGRR